MDQKCLGVGMIVLALCAGGAFYAGGWYREHALLSQGLLRSTPRMQGGNMGQNRFSGDMGQRFGGRSGDGSNRGFIAGDIVAKDAESVTIKLRDSSTKIVYYSPATVISTAVRGSVDDLVIGQSVMVSGASDTSGTVTAESIQVRLSESPVR